METETVSAIVAALSCGISVVSALLASHEVKMQRMIAAQLAAFQFTEKARELIADAKDDEILRFHNITKADFNRLGIKPHEAAYLIMSFSAGEAYHRIMEEDEIALGDYRKNLLNNRDVQRAWQELIRHRMISRSRFSEAVDKYIEQNPARG